jgi:hypothetical protein
VSTKLDPGVDPVAEADQRGSIMAVLRMGNMDMEMPGTMSPISANGHGAIEQTAYMQDAVAAPTPIGPAGPGLEGVPSAMVVGGSGLPGMPAPGPIAGQGGIPVWGMPVTGTPIGLGGPPHLPLGGPASLKSHTVRNNTKQELPEPVDHFLLDVKHEPGLRLPAPVKRVQYTERHPVYGPDEVNYPQYAVPPGQ